MQRIKSWTWWIDKSKFNNYKIKTRDETTKDADPTIQNKKDEFFNKINKLKEQKKLVKEKFE